MLEINEILECNKSAFPVQMGNVWFGAQGTGRLTWSTLCLCSGRDLTQGDRQGRW